MHNRPAGAPEGPLCKRPYPAWSPTAPPARRPEKTKPPAGDRGLRTLGWYGVKRIRHSLLAPQQGELRGGAATPNPSALRAFGLVAATRFDEVQSQAHAVGSEKPGERGDLATAPLPLGKTHAKRTSNVP